MVLGSVLLVAPGLVRRAGHAMTPLSSGGWLLVLPAAIFAAYRLLLLPHFPQTNSFSGDWYNHALYGTVFLIGFLIAGVDGIWSAITRIRWPALTLAAAMFVSFLFLRQYYGTGQPLPPALKIYAGMAYGCYQWFCIVAVLGFARRWLNRDGAARRYLTEAVFPYYIVHQTAIILIAHQLKGQGWPAWAEATIVIGGTVISCAVAYELVRRVRVLRPLFGLRPETGGGGAAGSSPIRPIRAET
jgi:hypothetical protein